MTVSGTTIFFTVVNMIIFIALPVGLIVLLVWAYRFTRHTKTRPERLEKGLRELQEKENK